MLVSCVIPVRDRAEMVCEAIASAHAQDWPELEVVVVDDGSVDDTAQIVATRYPQVRLVRLAGLGPGPARNAGVDVAHGEVIMFLDSDDLWLPGHVAALQAGLARGFEVAYGVARTTDLIAGTTFCIPESGQGREGEVLDDLLRWCFLVPSALALSRKAFLACGGFRPHAFGEDWSFLLQLAGRFPFAFAGEQPITQRRLHQGSLCALADRVTILAFLARLHDEVQGAEWCRPEMVERFAVLGQWVEQKNENWATVQEWYLAMREEGMV
ncbi:glycosyltransferase family 2 protein [Thermodesulfobacteriota bacterium]